MSNRNDAQGQGLPRTADGQSSQPSQPDGTAEFGGQQPERAGSAEAVVANHPPDSATTASANAASAGCSSAQGALAGAGGEIARREDGMRGDAICDPKRRLATGGLLATVIDQCIGLMAKDRAARERYTDDVHRSFLELCPPGVSSIEVDAAERVAIAKAKVLACDLITLDPNHWSAPDELFFKMQTRASKELDRVMKLYLNLRKVATSQPGFRVTVAHTEQDGSRSKTRSVSYEQLPDRLES